MVGYYDYVLLFIPLVLAGVAAGLTVLGFGLTVAVPAGAVASLPVIGHAMFVRTPRTADTVEVPSSGAGTDAGARAAD